MSSQAWQDAASGPALAGLKVLDLTHYIAGPYCTKLAAGFGAEVVKIERPPTGDPLRHIGPHAPGTPATECSLPFLWLNTGKKSVGLDLKSDAGRGLLKRMIASADVLVENFTPRVMHDWGLNYDVLRAINPRLVMVSISNFGQTGPWRDLPADEIELYAQCGAMYATGEADKAPLGPGVAVCQYAAGISAYTGMLLALFARQADGEGQQVDVSILENSIDMIETGVADHLQRGVVPRRGPHIFAPWGTYACQDGYVTVIGAPFRHWPRGAAIFEEPQLLDEGFQRARDRATRRAQINELIQPWLSRNTRRDICEKAWEHNLAFGYLASFSEVLDSPQLRERGFFHSVDHPVAGTLPYLDPPFRMSETPCQTGRAPLLAEHTAEVLEHWAQCSAAELRALEAQGVVR